AERAQRDANAPVFVLVVATGEGHGHSGGARGGRWRANVPNSRGQRFQLSLRRAVGAEPAEQDLSTEPAFAERDDVSRAARRRRARLGHFVAFELPEQLQVAVHAARDTRAREPEERVGCADERTSGVERALVSIDDERGR